MKPNSRIKDLYLAAFVYSKNKQLVGIERDGRICWFIFQDCEELISEYWKDAAIGKIKSYTDAIRTLKDLIYSQ